MPAWTETTTHSPFQKTPFSSDTFLTARPASQRAFYYSSRFQLTEARFLENSRRLVLWDIEQREVAGSHGGRSEDQARRPQAHAGKHWCSLHLTVQEVGGRAGRYVYFIAWSLCVHIVPRFQCLVQTLEEYYFLPPESNWEGVPMISTQRWAQKFWKGESKPCSCLIWSRTGIPTQFKARVLI